MSMKKITFFMFVSAILLSASVVSAQTDTNVLLVSDNEADYAVAEALKNVKNAEIVTTGWGTYSEDVVASVNQLNPDRIFIIGGPAAVPSEYENTLSNYSIIRISGRDRYETAAMTLTHREFKESFRGKGVFLANGYDSKGISTALEKAKRLGGIVLFVKPDDVPDEVLNATDDVDAEDIEVVESPDMDEDRINEKFRKKSKNIRIAKLNDTDKAERALRQIEEAEEEIGEAEEEIGGLSGSVASRLLDEAKLHLENAKAAYEGGSYGEAFGQATAAEHLAENAERKAKKTLDLGKHGKNGKKVRDDKDDDEEIETEDDAGEEDEEDETTEDTSADADNTGNTSSTTQNSQQTDNTTGNETAATTTSG